VDFCGAQVSRIAVGGNPFSGIGHQDAALDRALKDYYTVARIKQTLFQCEELGINTAFLRADNHIMRLLHEYWNEGGTIQWFAQHAPERRDILHNIRSAKGAGATGVYIQGGLSDALQENGNLEEAREPLALIHELGLINGIAGHQPKTHLDAQAMGLDYDFHMVCFYNITGRRGKIDVPDTDPYLPEDRQRAANLVRDELSLTAPISEVERIQWTAYEAITSCEVESVNRCHLMPGCLPTLEWLREQGVKMGIATSNSEEIARRILRERGIDDFFDAVIGRRPELRMKPYPDQILKCFEEIGVSPRQGVVVGDSVRDVAAARSTGIYAIAVPSYFTKREALLKAGADQIIEHLDELPEAVKGLNLSPEQG